MSRKEFEFFLENKFGSYFNEFEIKCIIMFLDPQSKDFIELKKLCMHIKKFENKDKTLIKISRNALYNSIVYALNSEKQKCWGKLKSLLHDNNQVSHYIHCLYNYEQFAEFINSFNKGYNSAQIDEIYVKMCNSNFFNPHNMEIYDLEGLRNCLCEMGIYTMIQYNTGPASLNQGANLKQGQSLFKR